ncbi:MAG: hypothetical protein R3F30_06940 [Planctomycetota bacterium]
MRRLPRIAAATVVALAALGPVVGHGIFEKTMWSDKANAATRGTAGAKATTLYMMQPPRFVTGYHQSIGWTITLQDEDASTAETVKLSFIPYASDGVSPETDPKKVIQSLQFNVFGLGMTGVQARNWLVTFGFPTPMPANFGVAIDLPANAQWPKDGLSVHAQLNLPQDSRRPRVPAPYDKRVYAFEQPAGALAPTPLGGRTLDVLRLGSAFIEPTIQAWLESSAYGLGTEVLWGLEALHPVASRGDKVGFYLDGGQFGTGEWGLLFASPKLLSTPIPFPRGTLMIDPAPAVLFQVFQLDSIGRHTTTAFPWSTVPATVRSFWVQAVVYQSLNNDLELSDAIGFEGL